MSKKSRKKLFKGLGIGLGILLLILIAIPFFLEAKMGDLIRTNVNKNINATFDFEEADLSLIRSFPHAELRMKGIRLINKAPFEGDTLFVAEEAGLTLALKELFRGEGEPIGLRRLEIDGATLNIVVDEQEQANYDIALETEPGTAEGEEFTFDLQDYRITNSRVYYLDRATGIRLGVEAIDHRGEGDLSVSQGELDTYTEGLVTFEMDSVNYLDKHRVQLDALIGLDIENQKYTFKENEALVNQLPLVFEGYVQVFEEHNEVDLSFQTPSSDFKNFLGLVPETYSKDLDGVQTAGEFTVNGFLKGRVDDTYIPKFDIQMRSQDASFKYPNLPREVSNIQLDLAIVNETGIAEDTYVRIRDAAFRIGQDRFALQSEITELMGNTRVRADIDADMDLAHLAEAYPMPADFKLKGKLRADVSTRFDMATLEAKRYENTQTEGYLKLTNFEYPAGALPKPVAISSMDLQFTPARMQLKGMQGKTGRSDFSASGTIDNLLGYLFNDQPIRGRFDLNSKVFDLGDFMPEETAQAGGDKEPAGGETPQAEAFKIPEFLDCSISARAEKVYYDNLELNNLAGTLRLQEGTASLSGMNAGLFGGRLELGGQVSTKSAKPTFNMDLAMKEFGISEAFQQMELLQALAPIARALEGKFTSTLKLQGLLSEDLSPDLASLTGNALAEVLASDLDPEKAKYLALLDQQLNFVNLDSLNIKGLKTYLDFKDGMVSVRPFNLTYKDLKVEVAGSHSFGSELSYQATLQVPSKYLGAEVNRLLGNIGDPELQNLKIPVIANIEGTYQDPKVRTDLAAGVKKLTTQLVEVQKQKALNQGKAKASELLGDLLEKNKDSTKRRQDSTRQGDARTIVEGVLGKKKAQDSVKQDSTKPGEKAVKDAARNVLGNLLGKKKKDTVPQ